MYQVVFNCTFYHMKFQVLNIPDAFMKSLVS